MKNFYPKQYDKDKQMSINHNYLKEQFEDYKDILKKIEPVIINGDFTLGQGVDDFEKDFAKQIGSKYAIGVGSGTDAIFLSLKALGIKEGDEVITTSFTFYATIGAIVTAGAKPVFVDIKQDFNIDADKIESAITNKTKAILPVHWSGNPCDCSEIDNISQKYNIPVVYDACHAILAKYKNNNIGSFGLMSCFSMHPLKNLNIWGDGGLIVSDDKNLVDKIRLMRNHGLESRDVCQIFSYNSRLDTIQAVVAQHLLDNKIDNITKNRIKNAEYFDKYLSKIPQITLAPRNENKQHVYHLYMFTCKHRDKLKQYLIDHDVDAKIHYPIPMHLQPAANFLNHKEGDFPVSESVANNCLSIPVHEFISKDNQDKIIELINEFYGENN